VGALSAAVEQTRMPSFDIVSEVDQHEVANATDQANREVGTRFDFKGTDSIFEREDAVITSLSQSNFQLSQMLDILQSKLSKRGVDIDCLEVHDPEASGNKARQKITVREGLDTDQSRAIVKAVKSSKLKVQASIQGNMVRISGKKRDDLQQAIALVKDLKLGMPLQFKNFRD
jgi:uncharacterized protein YajQ (UPF0234 family)